MVCISAEEFQAVLRSNRAVTPDEVALFHQRPVCEAVGMTQDCSKITREGLASIAQCERDLKAGQPVLAPCMARTHPQIVAMVTTACPEAAETLAQLREKNGVTKSTFSRGAIWALFASVAALGVAIAVRKR